jgi:serine protease Do
MNRRKTLTLLICLAWVLCEGSLHGQEPAAKGRARERGRSRRAVVNGKNEPAVKAAFQQALGKASAATARIVADGEEVALGAVVDPDGYLITKASMLGKKITCRFSDGAEKEATLVGSDEALDLALLHVEATHLPTVVWREGGPPPAGSFVATTAPGSEPVAVGITSAELRKIPPMPQPTQAHAWLGVGLGAGELGIGVDSVLPYSPAAKAGIRPGDEIRQIDGTAMKSAEQLVQLVTRSVPGQTLKLLVHRENGDTEIAVTLAKPRPFRFPQDEWGGGPFSERRGGFPAVVAHDTPLQPRDCGGPLVDTDGRVVGINIARALRVATYALPASLVIECVKRLKGTAR